MTEVYGGDEVNAVVVDTGSMWTRIGLAGGLSPAVTIPTSYAEIDGVRSFGDNALLVPKPNKELKNPISESVVSDWDAVQGLWSHAFKEASVDPTESPLLFTEQIWATNAQRQKTLEVALEAFNAPATYIIKSPVCSLFASGRGTGLVVDAGHQTLSVTPIVDLLALYKPLRRSQRAGEYLDSKIRELVGTPIPQFKVASRNPLVEKKIDATESFTTFHSNRVVQDFKEAMAQVAADPDSNDLQPRSYEFPDGRTVEYSDERYKLGESLFEDGEQNESMEESNLSPWSAKGVSSLIIDSIKTCDVDLRANLANNIVITGGLSLTQGFTERINNDLSNEFAGLKIRIHSPGNYVERKNSAWIGGSLVGSLGTFHQLWVSKAEYDEVGPDQLVQRRFT